MANQESRLMIAPNKAKDRGIMSVCVKGRSDLFCPLPHEREHS